MTRDKYMLLTIAAALVFITLGCGPPEPPPLEEPFVSEQLIGEWSGDWDVLLPDQEGPATASIERIDDMTLNWVLRLNGGELSDDETPPLEVVLQGADNINLVTVQGEVETLGVVTLNINNAGDIWGTVAPGTIPDVDVTGWVRPDEIRLDFAIYGLFPGYAILTPIGD